MHHPNIFDKTILLFDKHYIYPGQICEVSSKISVGIVRKILTKQPFWKVTNYEDLLPGTKIRYIGPVSNYRSQTDISDTNSFFETLVTCDTITISKEDKKYIVPSGKY